MPRVCSHMNWPSSLASQPWRESPVHCLVSQGLFPPGSGQEGTQGSLIPGGSGALGPPGL